MGANITDGAKYVMENGYSWFITDAIVVMKLKLKDQPFLSVKLKNLEGNKAKMVITDGNGHELYDIT
jgi:hypothetical protein